jgi:hypothetical protein
LLHFDNGVVHGSLIELSKPSRDRDSCTGLLRFGS